MRTDDKGPSALERVLAKQLAGVQLTTPETREAEYDQALVRVARRVGAMRDAVTRNQARVADRYSNLADKPEGQQATVLRNSSPTMLLALSYGLMKESYTHRFDDPAHCLALASLAHKAATVLAETDYLTPGSASDVIAESLGFLGNALRLNSDLVGAERALAEAEMHLGQGNRDRSVRACYCSFLASLRQTQGRAEEAASLFAREAAIWRLLQDPEKLGRALISSGLAACWIGDTLHAARLIREGTESVEDGRMMFLGLLHLAEAFARDGDGFQAWQLLCTGDLVAVLAEVGEGLNRRHRWVKAIAYRVQGELPYAERLLTAVRDEYVEHKEPLPAAFASLDLLAVLAAQGKQSDVIPLAEATYRILLSERLEQKALAAFMLLHQAALGEQLTEDLAVRVANFIVRHRHNREASFE